MGGLTRLYSNDNTYASGFEIQLESLTEYNSSGSADSEIDFNSSAFFWKFDQTPLKSADPNSADQYTPAAIQLQSMTNVYNNNNSLFVKNDDDTQVHVYQDFVVNSVANMKYYFNNDYNVDFSYYPPVNSISHVLSIGTKTQNPFVSYWPWRPPYDQQLQATFKVTLVDSADTWTADSSDMNLLTNGSYYQFNVSNFFLKDNTTTPIAQDKITYVINGNEVTVKILFSKFASLVYYSTYSFLKNNVVFNIDRQDNQNYAGVSQFFKRGFNLGIDSLKEIKVFSGYNMNNNSYSYFNRAMLSQATFNMSVLEYPTYNLQVYSKDLQVNKSVVNMKMVYVLNTSDSALDYTIKEADLLTDSAKSVLVPKNQILALIYVGDVNSVQVWPFTTSTNKFELNLIVSYGNYFGKRVPSYDSALNRLVFSDINGVTSALNLSDSFIRNKNVTTMADVQIDVVNSKSYSDIKIVTQSFTNFTYYYTIEYEE